MASMGLLGEMKKLTCRPEEEHSICRFLKRRRSVTSSMEESMTFPPPSPTDGQGSLKGRAVIVLPLGALLMAAFALRLLYLIRISLYVDEFITIWSAKLILQRGLPRTPAGVLYLRGFLFSYLDALFLGLLGFSEAIARLPSVLLGVVTVASIYLAGKRLFSPPVGLMAAALLTLAPDAVIWGGRARMYSLLQLLVLWAAILLFEGITLADRRRTWALFLPTYLGALWAHVPAMLLYPAFLLTMAWGRGWRWLLGKRGSMVSILALAAVLSRYVLDRVGGGQLAPVQNVRPYLQFPADILGNLRGYSKFFLQPHNLPLSILVLFGSLYLMAKWTRARVGGKDSRAREGEGDEGLAFLCLLFWVPFLEMVMLGGATWRDSRYLFMLQPFFFLIASAISVQGLRWLIPRISSKGVESVKWPITLTLLALASFLNLPATLSVLSTQIEGYDRAMHFVAQHWQENDVILMAMPPTSAVYLDRCDYFAIQRDYEKSVVKQDGVLVDMWVGAPLLNTVPELERVLKESPRVWFVIDGWRLATHYQMDFLEVIARVMEVVHRVQGVKVLLSQGYVEAEEPTAARSLEVKLEEGISLLGYELSATSLEPGEELRLTLYWHTEKRLSDEYMIFVHLLNREGFPGGQGDSPPMRGLYPTIYWQEGERVPDEHRFQVAADAPPGRYFLEVGIYSPQSEDRLAVLDDGGEAIDDRIVLDYIEVGKEEPGRPQHSAEADFGGEIMLVGYDFDGQEKRLSVEPGQAIPVTLYWRALGSMDRDYTIFLHLLDEAGEIWGQKDSQPLGGFYPTSFWDGGESVEDRYELTVDPNAPAGDYTLVVGLYFLPTGERLHLPNEERDMVILGEVTVTR